MQFPLRVPFLNLFKNMIELTPKEVALICVSIVGVALALSGSPIACFFVMAMGLAALY